MSALVSFDDMLKGMMKLQRGLNAMASGESVTEALSRPVNVYGEREDKLADPAARPGAGEDK